MSQFKIEWIDRGREPQCAPNPLYPSGVDVDISEGALLACTAELPYPAKRCGVYAIRCKTCGRNVGCTTAGRSDDPRSLTLACKGMRTKTEMFSKEETK